MQCLNWETELNGLLGFQNIIVILCNLHGHDYIKLYIGIYYYEYLIILYINCRGEISLYYFLSYK